MATAEDLPKESAENEPTCPRMNPIPAPTASPTQSPARFLSITKRNIRRRHINIENIQLLQRIQNLAHNRPFFPKLLALLGFPFRQNLLRKLRPHIDVGSSKIEPKRFVIWS